MMTTDPVCGMRVSEETPYRYVYQGKTYLFCSKQCVHSFQHEPEKYLAHDKETHESKPTPSGLYVCPMHPYAMQPGPGPCPKCGVAMEPLEEINPDEIKFVTGTLHPR